MKSRRGFTLIELLLAIAIFSFVIVAFITMFLVITRVQVRQSSLAEVNSQSQFLLQEIQYYVEQSSLIDMPTDTPTTTLKMRMPGAAIDPTIITLASGTLYLQQGTGTLQALSSNKVSISNLSFTKRANAPAKDSVSVAMTIAYNTLNPQQLFSEMLQTSVARVSAATFDSNVIPSSTATYSLGVAGQVWNWINGLIYFSGSNVGIGSSYSNPQQTLDVNGGIRVNSTGAQPSCNASNRGTFWDVQSGGGDSLKLCVFSSSSIYTWATIY